MNAFIFLAEGFEEIEAIAPVDILRRGNVNTYTISISDSLNVTSSRGITIVADKKIDEIIISKEDILILPGGAPGTQNLGKSEPLLNLLRAHHNTKSMIAAICAAPSIVGKLGLLKGVKATCYPGVELSLEGAHFLNQPVVIDKNFITAQGAGVSINFGLAILESIKGKDVSDEIRKKMLA